MVGPKGLVFCVDVQEKMIQTLEKRAQKAWVINRIKTRICNQTSYGMDDIKAKVDFALAFAVVHEIPDQDRFYADVHAALKPNGKFLLAEPKGHISSDRFTESLALAGKNHLKIIETPAIARSHSALLAKI